VKFGGRHVPLVAYRGRHEPPGAFGEHAILLGHHPPLSNQATTIGDQFARRGDRLLRALPLPLDFSLAARDRKVRPISRPDGRGSTTAIDVVDGARSRHQTHLVAELRQLARPMVRRGTGLNADQARRHAKATRSKVRFRTQLGV
jgi:hypothetical protein